MGNLLPTKEQLEAKRAEYIRARDQLDGAIMAIGEIIAMCYPEDALTLDELKEMTGAQSVEVVENAG